MMKPDILKGYIHIASYCAISLILSGCGGSLPETYTESDKNVRITPDYTELTIPCNIAPLNFRIEESGDSYITHIHSDADKAGIIIDGKTTDIDIDDWHELLHKAKGDSITVDIYTSTGGKWTKYPSIRHAVADSIDPYISYRLIEPSYISFETMSICQRHLESFDEREIFNSQALSTEQEGQCMNCHSYQDYNRDGNMQMHIRVRHGGTLISHNGELKKVTLKTPDGISSGVYPSWHPRLPLIAYSVNTTSQSFHTSDRNKVEVQDAASDLILYDVEGNKVSTIANEETELETFPYWHPDGKSLWYVSAKIPSLQSDDMKRYQNEHFEDFRYDIYRRTFDERSRQFGPADTIFKASALGQSATLPRPSPDGRYLLFTMAPYGTFHIWHRESDLYLLDTKTGEIRAMDEINSNDVESYHSWSSDGRWIIFSTRRDDGSYTRLYLVWFGPDGKARKAFPLPQPTPDYEQECMKSYNVPEFMVSPVTLSKKKITDAIEKSAINATPTR